MSSSDKVEEKEEEKKVDIKALVSIIPPASALKKTKSEIKEKRVKMRKKADVEQGVILMSAKLAAELNIKDEAEVSVKGKRSRFKVIVQEGLPDNEIWGSAADMMKLGLEDNSTVSVRAVQ